MLKGIPAVPEAGTVLPLPASAMFFYVLKPAMLSGKGAVAGMDQGEL